MRPITFHLDDDLNQALNKIQEEKGCSLKWFFNEATKRMLIQEGYIDKEGSG